MKYLLSRIFLLLLLYFAVEPNCRATFSSTWSALPLAERNEQLAFDTLSRKDTLITDEAAHYGFRLCCLELDKSTIENTGNFPFSMAVS